MNLQSTTHGDPALIAPPERLFPLTRQLSYRLTPLIARLPITPNQITVASMLLGLAGAGCFAAGSWPWDIGGALLLIAGYALDNCDGDIARMKNLCSEFGAALDDAADWLVDASVFAALGYGTASSTGESLWLWLGLAAAGGATIDYVIDRILERRQRSDPQARSREQQGREPKKPKDATDWAIYVLHKLSRADFPFILLALALLDLAWIVLPPAAIGAQIYWITDLFERARGWHV